MQILYFSIKVYISFKNEKRRGKEKKMKWKRRRKKKEEEEEEIKNKTNQSYKTKNTYQTGTLCTVIWKINNKKILSHHSDDKIQTINILMFLAQIFIVLKFSHFSIHVISKWNLNHLSLSWHDITTSWFVRWLGDSLFSSKTLRYFVYHLS